MNHIFATSSVQHALEQLSEHLAHYKCIVFNDGELYVKLEDVPTQQTVTVITATPAPSSNFFELFFLLDTLAQHQRSINLVFTYFGYARQDHPKPNVARSAHVVHRCLAQFPIISTTIVHCHSDRLKEYFDYTSWIPYTLYATIAQQNAIDIVVSPDQGAITACQDLARLIGCECGYIQKMRSNLDQTHTIALHANVLNKRVLIVDDIISTGRTAAQAAHLIAQAGAREIMMIATHNLANHQTVPILQQSHISKYWITNSINNQTSWNNLTIVDIMPSLFAYLEHNQN